MRNADCGMRNEKHVMREAQGNGDIVATDGHGSPIPPERDLAIRMKIQGMSLAANEREFS